MVRAFLLVGAVGIAAGCGGGTVVFPGPPELELGTGFDQFVAVADGDAVQIIHGLQGGYHIWGSVRARYLDPHQLFLRFTVTLSGDSALQALRENTADLTGTSDGLGEGELDGTAVIFKDVRQVEGRPCDWTVAAMDAEGRTAQAVKRGIVPTGGPALDGGLGNDGGPGGVDGGADDGPAAADCATDGPD
jgi:hypothetical protein